jgi:hypothetical protein
VFQIVPQGLLVEPPAEFFVFVSSVKRLGDLDSGLRPPQKTALAANGTPVRIVIGNFAF